MTLNKLIAIAALLFSTLAQAAFDPVHEDIDIFMVNPSIASERPNVLIVLDTTANWSTYFASEKSSLISVVNGLTNQYNVGLMLFTGGSIEGSYMRYAIRQMNATNKSALSSLVNDLSNSPSTNFSGDKTNNGVPGQAMVEAYRYFTSRISYSGNTGHGHDPRTDYSGNTDNSWITNLAGNAFPTTPTTASLYSSPVVDGCQRNFIIYISNGKGSNQTGEKTTAKNELATAQGATPTAYALSPSGNETDSWFDEWAGFMANTGFSVTLGGAAKTIYANTYAVEINPGTQSSDLQWTATLKSGSNSHGKGKYYATTGGDPGAQLTEALNKIFNEIQAVNSVFASTTLPVSVNVRGTNLNQVYIGMFRPDSAKAPRWFGNLKLYKLALVGGDLQLVDSANQTAESQTTGFIIDTATSYWTHDSSFWDFRDSSENGKGAQSDSPDGDLVEKGAVAQLVRDAFATDQSTRNLYTCTSACTPCVVGASANGTGTDKACTGGSTLSSTPFSTANNDITSIALALGTKDVSPLTGKITKTVTAISDRRNVALSNASGAVFTISALSNGATSKVITGITPFDVTKQMNTTALSALTTSMSAIAVSGKSSSASSATLTFASGGFSSNPCAIGNTVVVSGNDSSVNGSWSVTGIAGPTSNKYSVTFTVNGTASPNNSGTLYCAAKSTVATATVAALPAGLAVNSRINISGATPTDFNGDFTVTAVSGNTFKYTIPSLQGIATTQGTLKVYNTVSAGAYSATSSTVRITVTSASHGFSAGNTVTLTGNTPSYYDTSGTVNSSPATNSFSFDFANATSNGSWPFIDATAYGTVYSGGSTTVHVTTSAAHGLASGSSVDVTGVNSCYNGSGKTISNASGSTFDYTTSAICAPVSSIPGGAQIAASSYTNTVTATLTSHGFSDGDSIIIADGTTAAHNGTFTVLSHTANTFTYNYTGACPCVGPSGQYTVRLATNPLAYVTATAHGFSSGDQITIAGANPSGYNLTTTASGTPTASANMMVIDANTFSYPLSSAPGINTSNAVTAAKNTTTAYAHSVAHGFADQSSVTISGATPTVFNGSFTITMVDDNNFTYTLPSAQGDASGTILAAAGTGSNSERDQIINWVRGANNAKTTGNENTAAADTSCRATVHGDVLHSRPAVINYNRYAGDNDVYVFYGANDGVFHAVKGGTANDVGDPTTLNPGDEAWGLVPTEGFTNLKRLRNNSPVIGSSFKKPYFMDGPIGVYSVDGNSDGKISSGTASDHVYLYVGARRGGRYIYSLDVTDPVTPKYRWKIDNTTSGFSELGYTWSQPTPVTNIEGYSNPVLIFGGGYDPSVEDIENCAITGTTAASSSGAYTAATVTYKNGTLAYNSTGTGCTITGGSTTTVSRGMGRAIYVVDAVTGALVWHASYRGSGADLEVTGMDYAIPSDITVIKNLSGDATNRAYVGDTGGNLWRIDFGGNTRNWKVTKIAAIADLTTLVGTAPNQYVTGYRKFMNPPDVVAQTGFDAVVLGSGDREHPFDNTVVNRFYMFKDRGNDVGPGTGTTYYYRDTNGDNIGDTYTIQTRTGVADGSGNPVITHSPSVATDGQLTDVTTTATDVTASDGWFFTLGTGEKTIGNAVALNGVVFFNTNQPSQTEDSSCVGNLGVARQYQVGVENGLATDYVQGDTVTLADRSTIHPGGGFLPSPVHVVVQVTDPYTGALVTKEGVISGTSVQTPSTGAIGSRTRRFWYKEIDE